MTENKTEAFSAKEHLTASEYAKKHDLPITVVQRAIAELQGVTFKRGLSKKPIIVRIGTATRRNHISPEPAAQEIFQEKIKQILSREKNK